MFIFNLNVRFGGNEILDQLRPKAYVSEEILNWHCLSLSINADLCVHFY